MSMTELERHLLNCLEGLQQKYTLSQESQDKRLTNLEECQKEQEINMNQLIALFKDLDPLLQRLNSILDSAWCTK